MTAAFDGVSEICGVFLSMVCGYPIGSGCVVCSGSLESDCVFPEWVIPSMGFNLARTSLCCREGWFLCAIIGGLGRMWLNILLFPSVFFSTYLSLWVSSQKCATKTDFYLSIVFRFLFE